MDVESALRGPDVANYPNWLANLRLKFLFGKRFYAKQVFRRWNIIYINQFVTYSVFEIKQQERECHVLQSMAISHCLSLCTGQPLSCGDLYNKVYYFTGISSNTCVSSFQNGSAVAISKRSLVVWGLRSVGPRLTTSRLGYLLNITEHSSPA